MIVEVALNHWGKISQKNLQTCNIHGPNKGLKALADPPHFSPEFGAPETLRKSPETVETMTSLTTTIDIEIVTMGKGYRYWY